MQQKLNELRAALEGEFYADDAMRILYSTDASAYAEMPLAVAVPRTVKDIARLISFARENHTSLIPRTAGTSLAGQVVGSGIVVDVSKHFNKILQLNVNEHWVKVQPGVVRDELNLFLKPHGLFFGPETSTANRAMIGGMVGNNSCGSNSIVYKSMREHLLEVKALLSDGSGVEFKSLSFDDFIAKCNGETLEAAIYRNIRAQLSDYSNQVEIKREFPKRGIERRNTGYAIDALLESDPFTAGGKAFNFCKLIAGSEGTLAFITEIKLNLSPLPPPVSGLLCIHFNSVDEALRANLIALKYSAGASELIDHYILECTKDNIEQRENRFFVSGNPGAILVVEFSGDNESEIKAIALKVEAEMREAKLGYHFPLLFGNDTRRIWALRKAGLGLLSNLPGDAKPVAVIEDTAVAVEDLPAYIAEFNTILQKYGLDAVHYAHAGSGEIHLRPILNLKTEEGNRLFRVIAQEIALLVKKYQGSLSGEHGDGRLRGEFIEQMIGAKNFGLIKEIKATWDPHNIFNPGKIVDTPQMNTNLRYNPGQQVPAIKTAFRYNGQNVLQHAEQCNGSGDCRKSHLMGGTMCPSYMATRNEKDTTRARANILRSYLTNSTQLNRFNHPEIKEVMDLCLSCKGCKSECPSNVDMAKLKAEFLQHYHDANGVPFRTKLVAAYAKLSQLGAFLPGVYNFLVTNKFVSQLLKNTIGFANKRSLPRLCNFTLQHWFSKRKGYASDKKVYFFCDEYTNYQDANIGLKAVELLERLGYQVIVPKHYESGRAAISKGLLRKAKSLANKNVELLSQFVDINTPLIGIEPSAILTFRDEFPDLVDEHLLQAAHKLSSNSLLIDEFIAREMKNGNIKKDQFTHEPKTIKLHGHCQQKALNLLGSSQYILSFPKNFHLETIPSGCCGMAGSFGYEKEHYELSMQIGELVLLPAVRNAPEEVIIAATGISCRHQILDGANRTALHPVEILYDALL
ncbi:FAD-binding and (Fe-S)-binding domain-containing protein [Mucilaginibacter aquatilis]|uniref:FAD-binding protein n=1 Tax=Mucilaginibacter aquatilis TaxID=1517760 RepID=A0A6I4IBA9_9SPHI|nr:FAD-binding and (Fe-S)-binding domain-containing protein [Mucilaginibacter aquatilis]MVN91218.1 FAD-binding protein [Mucilaginibacter aquatilis]